MSESPRIVYRVHSSAGRLRLRLPWLRQTPEDATRISAGLAELDGLQRVEVRPRTGSVLCEYDEELLDAEAVVRAVVELAAAARAGELGEEAQPGRREEPIGSGVARAAVASVRQANRDVLRATEGSLDLATLSALTFLVAGGIEILVTRKLPMPPWFQLGWWAVRTFTTFEQPAIEEGSRAVRQARVGGT
ncbi:MAG: HMA2 domain-containing protein [Myxococcaceae bacterium]